MVADVGRLFAPPKGSYFLLGPRGSGKSTLLRTLHPTAHWVDLLDEGVHHDLLVDPSLFGSELDALPNGSLVVVDEIQRLPSLLNTVHQKIERKRMRFALSGSSARKLRRGSVNLLAGRAVRRQLYPFVPEELGSEFQLARVLEIGSLPVIWRSPDPADALAAYVRMYLKEEIQAEAVTRNLAGFARFLPIAALFHGQALNVSALARDAGVARSTVQGYLEILEDTLLAFTLPAYEARLRVREKKHPKLYWVDPGLVRAARQESGPPSAEAVGSLFEGWVATLFTAYREYRGLYDEMFYWAPADAERTEVDFLLRRGRKFVAIEAKAARRLKPEFLKGLRAIGKLPGVERRILVYLGDRVLRPETGIEVLPIGEFLAQLEAGL